MTRRRLIIGASIAVAAVVGWWCVVRPWRQLAEAGISVGAVGRSWRCTTANGSFECLRQSSNGIVPFEMFAGSLRTMSLQQIQHEWQVADSLEWSQARDSIARALLARGGAPHTCATMDSLLSTPPDTAVIRLRGAVPPQTWRLADQDEMVGAQHGPGSDDWTIDIIAFPDRMPPCRPPRRRLMTVHEALAAIHRTIAEQIGF